MRIGIDIDGVTADSISTLIQKLNLKTRKNLALDKITKYNLTEVFECDKKIFQKILNEFDYFHLKPIDGSVEYTQKLVENIPKLLKEKCEIYFLTSRLHIIKNWLYKFEVFFDTYLWLESNFKNKEKDNHKEVISNFNIYLWLKSIFKNKNHKYYKKVIFASDKAEYAEKHNLDWVIDDDPSVVEKCIKRRIPVLLFDYPYNQGLEKLNGVMISRVDSWKQIYDIIINQRPATNILT